MAVGGLNEGELAVAYNDIDFCLKLAEKGFRTLYNPYAELVHHESASRGLDVDEKRRLRLRNESDYMVRQWADFINRDPYYSQNLTTSSEDFSLAWPPRTSM